MPYLGNKPADRYLSLDKQTFTTSATATYALNNPVANANEIDLFLNNVKQEPTEAYTASGNTLTLSNAITASDAMYCVYLGKSIGTINPSDGSVGTSQILNSAVTDAKIVDGTIGLGKLSATGTKNSTTFLRGDNTFAVPAGGVNTPAFQAYLSTSQSIANNTWTKVNFETEDFDTGSCYNNSSTYRFTPTTSGKYYIFSSIRTSTTNNSVAIYKNGSVIKVNNLIYSGDGSNFVYTLVSANGSTDYFEIYAIHSYGSTRDINGDGGGGQKYSTFGAFKIIE